jgi:hypothetical protein
VTEVSKQICIDKTDWNAIEPSQWAEKIPNLIRILLSSAPSGDQEAAVQTLKNYIAHQSGLYDTTLGAIPVLLYLLNHPSVNDKLWILQILAAIRIDYVVSHTAPESNEFARRVYNELKTGLSTIETYLSHHHDSYREFAVRILSRFVLDLDRVLPQILEQLEVEKSLGVQKSLLIALGDIANIADQPSIQKITEILETWSKVSNFELKCEAVISWLKVHTGDLATPVQDGLIDCVHLLATSSSRLSQMETMLIASRICTAAQNLNETIRRNLLTELANASKESAMHRIFRDEII